MSNEHESDMDRALDGLEKMVNRHLGDSQPDPTPQVSESSSYERIALDPSLDGDAIDVRPSTLLEIGAAFVLGKACYGPWYEGNPREPDSVCAWGAITLGATGRAQIGFDEVDHPSRDTCVALLSANSANPIRVHEGGKIPLCETAAILRAAGQ